MREIKFRAWERSVLNEVMYGFQHKDDKGKLVPLFFSLNSLLDGWGSDMTDTPEGEDAPPSLPDCVEQYTGLHDKNGREIYEGDIFRWTMPNGWRNPLSGERVTEDTTTISVVFFDEGCFSLRSIDFPSGLETLLNGATPRNEYGEVIGNIHENPELMKEAKNG